MKLITIFLLALASLCAQTVPSEGSRTGDAGTTQDNSGAAHTLPSIVVSTTGSLPSSGCKAGELALVTGATLGQQIYENSGTGSCTWTQQANSGGTISTTGSPASPQLAKFSASTTITTATAADVAATLYAVGGGSANAQTAAYSPAITSLTNGLAVWWL